MRTFGTTGVPYLTDGYQYFGPVVTFVLDQNNLIFESIGYRLVKLNPDGNFLWSFGEAGVPGADNNHFGVMGHVAADSSGKIYVPDLWNGRVQIISPDGNYLNTLGTGCGSGYYEFCGPTAVAIDNANNIYVADQYNQRLMIYDSNLVYIGRIGETEVCNSDNDHLCSPSSVAVDSSGNIYIAIQATIGSKSLTAS